MKQYVVVYNDCAGSHILMSGKTPINRKSAIRIYNDLTRRNLRSGWGWYTIEEFKGTFNKVTV